MKLVAEQVEPMVESLVAVVEVDHHLVELEMQHLTVELTAETVELLVHQA
jgi:hypothetical protein